MDRFHAFDAISPKHFYLSSLKWFDDGFASASIFFIFGSRG